MPKTFTLDDITLMVYSIAENSTGVVDNEYESFTYEQVCDFMNLDADTTQYVLEEISKDLACA